MRRCAQVVRFAVLTYASVCVYDMLIAVNNTLPSGWLTLTNHSTSTPATYQLRYAPQYDLTVVFKLLSFDELNAVKVYGKVEGDESTYNATVTIPTTALTLTCNTHQLPNNSAFTKAISTALSPLLQSIQQRLLIRHSEHVQQAILSEMLSQLFELYFKFHTASAAVESEEMKDVDVETAVTCSNSTYIPLPRFDTEHAAHDAVVLALHTLFLRNGCYIRQQSAPSSTSSIPTTSHSVTFLPANWNFNPSFYHLDYSYPSLPPTSYIAVYVVPLLDQLLLKAQIKSSASSATQMPSYSVTIRYCNALLVEYACWQLPCHI